MTLNLSTEWNPYTKESQLFNNSIKLSQRQLGEISQKVDKQLKSRSQGICERCKSTMAVHRAHLIRRGKLTNKTDINTLAHLCVSCHQWADSCKEGRLWLEQFRQKLLGA